MEKKETSIFGKHY